MLAASGPLPHVTRALTLHQPCGFADCRMAENRGDTRLATAAKHHQHADRHPWGRGNRPNMNLNCGI